MAEIGRGLRVLRAARTAWVMVGLTLLLALVLEGGARLVTAVRARFVGIDYRARSDALADSPWIEEYFGELFRSTRLEWRSYVYWRRRPFSGRYVNVDEDGFRRTWRAPETDAGGRAVRIFAFGGSTMWGMGARDEFTIPSQLAKLVAEHAPEARVEVTNYGELGYVSTQELVSLELALRRGDVPDVVLFYDAINDVFASFQNGEAGSPQNEVKRQTAFEHLRRAALLDVAFGSAALQPLLQRVQRAAWLDGYARRTPEQRQALARDTLDVIKANLGFAEALGQRYGFRTLAYWQPAVFSKRRPTEGERRTAAKSDLWREFFEATYALAARDPDLARNPAFHDIQDVFGEDPRPYYFDCCHTNERANEVVARRMLADVVPLLGSRR
jgi:lysophospholipase L1-like esterase